MVECGVCGLPHATLYTIPINFLIVLYPQHVFFAQSNIQVLEMGNVNKFISFSISLNRFFVLSLHGI